MECFDTMATKKEMNLLADFERTYNARAYEIMDLREFYLFSLNLWERAWNTFCHKLIYE